MPTQFIVELGLVLIPINRTGKTGGPIITVNNGRVVVLEVGQSNNNSSERQRKMTCPSGFN
jgi:hypothetical protein